jgi:hypothetical protein
MRGILRGRSLYADEMRVLRQGQGLAGSKKHFRKRWPGAVGGAGASACQPPGLGSRVGRRQRLPHIFHEISRAEGPSQQATQPPSLNRSGGCDSGAGGTLRVEAARVLGGVRPGGRGAGRVPAAGSAAGIVGARTPVTAATTPRRAYTMSNAVADAGSDSCHAPRPRAAVQGKPMPVPI